jgi:hypothetical protein
VVCYDAPVTNHRRRFLGRLGLGSAAAASLFGSASASAQPPSSAAPKRHELDDWMDTLPAGHRMVFDAVSAEGAQDVQHYASNVFFANRTGYGLESRDIGVIVILRHNATPLGYNDAMWAKYGSVFATELKLPATKTNPGNGGGESLETLSGLGVHFGVCAMATRRFAGMVTRGTGNSIDAALEELGKNLVRNAHLTPAGIVAVGRAQERGFTFGYAG